MCVWCAHEVVIFAYYQCGRARFGQLGAAANVFSEMPFAVSTSWLRLVTVALFCPFGRVANSAKICNSIVIFGWVAGWTARMVFVYRVCR